MIIININKIDYHIFENTVELYSNNLVYKDIHSCQANDYIKSDNGYFLPVIYRKLGEVRRKNKFTKFPYRIDEIKLPYYLYSNMFFIEKQEFRYKPLVWKRDIDKQLPVKISPQQKYIVKLMSEGVDLYTAFSSCYRNKSVSFNSFISNMLDNEIFMKYLLENGGLMTLKKSLEDIGANEQWLAQQIKDCAESNDNKLKIFGMTLAKEAFNSSTELVQAKQITPDGMTQEFTALNTNVSEDMKHKFLNPQPLEFGS